MRLAARLVARFWRATCLGRSLWSRQFPGCASAPCRFAFEDELVAMHFPTPRIAASILPSTALVLAPMTPVILAVPLTSQPAWCPPHSADCLPCIVNAHFRVDPPAKLPADTRRDQRHQPVDICAAGPDLCDHQRRRRPVSMYRAPNLRKASGMMLRPPPACRRRCRRGNRCASGAQPSNRHQTRMRAAPDRKRAGATCCLPGTGRQQGSPRRSRARSAPVIVPPSLSAAGWRPRHDVWHSPRRRRCHCGGRSAENEYRRHPGAAAMPAARRALGCFRALRRMRRFLRNTCCFATFVASRSTRRLSGKSPSTSSASGVAWEAGPLSRGRFRHERQREG